LPTWLLSGSRRTAVGILGFRFNRERERLENRHRGQEERRAYRQILQETHPKEYRDLTVETEQKVLNGELWQNEPFDQRTDSPTHEAEGSWVERWRIQQEVKPARWS
jgi:hypothetical protein